MLSKIPFDMKNLKEEDIRKQVLRIGIIAELDAINLYEQLARMVSDERIRKIFLDIAKEEKTHVGEFLSILLEIDEEQKNELKRGEEEVKNI